VPRLRRVRIERDWIYAQIPTSNDTGNWWDPITEYFQHPDRPPHKVLLSWKSDQQNVIRFLERFGPLSRNHGTAENAMYLLSEWKENAGEFNFALLVAANLKNAPKLRTLVKAVANRSWPLRKRLMTALGTVPEAFEDRLTEASDREIEVAAREYLELAINDQQFRTAFEFTGENARLYIFLTSEDLLKSFYWMLAHSLAAETNLRPAIPVECKSCGTVFFTQKRNQFYCARRKCNELGRKRLYWSRKNGPINAERRRANRQKRA